MFSPAVKGAALVTGAAKGLGRVIALRLAADGFNVAISDLPSNKALLEDLKREITTTLNRRSTVLLGDVSSETDVKDMVGAVTKHLGSLDVMVANAAVLLPKPLAPIIEMSVEDLDASLAINVRGVFLCYRYAALQMIAQGRGGRIIGAASIAGRVGWSGSSAYSASKFAVRGLTQVAGIRVLILHKAQELGLHKITVNAYAPGQHLQYLTSLFIDPKFPSAAVVDPAGAQNSVLGHPGDPADVAGVVSFLASRDADFITGASYLLPPPVWRLTFT
ncbi:hypothetical protein C8R44DRAFT_638602 [Mycena epipterygia]|nr:hypothetical protein C8R44DRAFT_638602 [Mycena epipterygia]